MGKLVKSLKILGIWMVSDFLVIWCPSEASPTLMTPSHPYPLGKPDCSKVSGERDLQPRNPLKGEHHGLCIRPSAYIPNLRGQAYRVSRPKKGSSARALMSAWEASQSTFSRAAGCRWALYPTQDGAVTLLSKVGCLRAGVGEPGQGAWRAGSSQPGAHLWRTPWGWEQNVDLRQKLGSALCLHHLPPRPFMPPSRHTWNGSVWKEAVQRLPAHHRFPTLTCTRLCSGSWRTCSWSCRIGGRPPSKACMAPSMEEGVQGGLG